VFVDALEYRKGKDIELRRWRSSSPRRRSSRAWISSSGPLNPYERRIVHLAVRRDSGVSTESVGDAFSKTFLISVQSRHEERVLRRRHHRRDMRIHPVAAGSVSSGSADRTRRRFAHRLIRIRAPRAAVCDATKKSAPGGEHDVRAGRARRCGRRVRRQRDQRGTPSTCGRDLLPLACSTPETTSSS